MAFDFIALQKQRIYSQYRDKLKAVKWFEINPTIGNKLSIAYQQITDSYVIDDNEGEQLDVVGRIVGQTRQFQATGFNVITPTSDFDKILDKDDYTSERAQDAMYCTKIEDSDQAPQFGPDTYPYAGQLNDIQYRQALKARIQKNASTATIDEIIEGVKLVLGESAQVALQDNLNMTFSIYIDAVLDERVRFALTTDLIVNRPQGVKFLGYITNSPQFVSIETVEAHPEEAELFGPLLNKTISNDDEQAKKAVYFIGALGGDT